MPTPPEPAAGDDLAITAGRPPRGAADARMADGTNRSGSAQASGVFGIRALSVVNYTESGLDLDVYPHESLDPIIDYEFYNVDLAAKS